MTSRSIPLGTLQEKLIRGTAPDSTLIPQKESSYYPLFNHLRLKAHFMNKSQRKNAIIQFSIIVVFWGLSGYTFYFVLLYFTAYYIQLFFICIMHTKNHTIYVCHFTPSAWSSTRWTGFPHPSDGISHRGQHPSKDGWSLGGGRSGSYLVLCELMIELNK